MWEWEIVMRRRPKTALLLFAACLIAAPAIVWRTCWYRPEPSFLPAEALRHVQLEAPRQPVPKELLELNSTRKALGVSEIGEDWAVAPTRMVIMEDGPSIHVLVNGEGTPSKVILWRRVGLSGRSGHERIAEYQVRGGKIAGLALIWAGRDKVLERTEEYRSGRLASANYYSTEGEIVASCRFRHRQPWDGRHLQRTDPAFGEGGSDISYRGGKLHGEEWQYSKGKRPVRMRTFRDGVLHGPSRFYNEDGSLAHEYSYVDGVSRRHRSWYSNGQLQFEIEFDAEGHHVGVERKWSPDGTPKL